MFASVDRRTCPPGTVRQKFIAYTALRFAVATAIGALIALGEYCAWLPCHLTDWIDTPSLSSPYWLSIAGPTLTQTLAAPLLMFAGLHRMGYPYASRILYNLFWVLHGVDIWRFLLLLSREDWKNWPMLVLMIALIFAMAYIMLRIHLSATAGVECLPPHSTCALSPVAYVLTAARLWGALLITQFVFNVSILLI